MNIKIHTHQLDMSDPLRAYAERHIADVINNIYKKQAATLNIEFSDAIGGREKACKVTFFVPPGKTLVATAQDANPYAAVDLAADRIAREVLRLKEKRLTTSRHGLSPASLPASASEMVEEEETEDFSVPEELEQDFEAER